MKKLIEMLPIVVLVSLVDVNAGVKMKMESKTLTSGSVSSGWLYVGDDNHLRIDSEIDPGTGKPESTIIYRGDINAMYMIDHEEEQFLRLDEAQIKVLGERLNSAMKQMQEQLAKMPEAQRKMMEDMMKKNMPQAEAGMKVDVRTAGSDQGYKKYEIWIGNEKRSEVWATTPEKLGIPSDAFAVFKNMSSFYDELLEAFRNNPMMSSVGENPFTGFTEMDGFPARILHIKENQETTISPAEQSNFPGGFFDPPAGYEESRPDIE